MMKDEETSVVLILLLFALVVVIAVVFDGRINSLKSKASTLETRIEALEKAKP